ncbi:MAG: Hsp20/alpha crystallin family protein [Candidatus Omnitrophica bacterium]|nr:Hsp20/alpha crystallin family protein [Candidatus Omnitrophota bacterium]
MLTQANNSNFYCAAHANDIDIMLPLARLPKSASHQRNANRLPVWRPAVEIYENAQQFVVKVELPGIDPDKVDVQISESSLFIHNSKTCFNRKKNRSSAFLPEFQDFTRFIALPAAIHPGSAKIVHQNGELTVHLPKHSPSQPKSIKIHFEN